MSKFEVGKTAELTNHIRNPSFEHLNLGYPAFWSFHNNPSMTNEYTDLQGRAGLVKIGLVNDEEVHGYVSLYQDITGLVPNTMYTGAIAALGATAGNEGIFQLSDHGSFANSVEETITNGEPLKRLVVSKQSDAQGRLRVAIRARVAFGGDPTTKTVFDCAMLVQGSIAPPYFDGDTADSVWLGPPHISKSRRLVKAAGNNPMLDLVADLGMKIHKLVGFGATEYEQETITDAAGMVQLSNLTERPRTLAIVATIPASTRAELMEKRAAILEAFISPSGHGPRVFRFTDDSGHALELPVWYAGGLDGSNFGGSHMERVTIRLTAYAPRPYETEPLTMNLNPIQTLTSRYMSQYNRETGWVSYTQIGALNKHLDMMVLDIQGYILGVYNNPGTSKGQVFRNDGAPGAEWRYIGEFNTFVNDMAISLDGSVCFVGAFTLYTPNGGSALTMLRVASADFLTTGVIPTFYDGAANAEVGAVTYASDGYFYFAGFFTSIFGWAVSYTARAMKASNAIFIFAWQIGAVAAYNALPRVILVEGPIMYIGGDFTTIGGIGYGKVAALNMITGIFNFMSTGISHLGPRSIASNRAGKIWMAGTRSGGTDFYLMEWNGSKWVEWGFANGAGAINDLAYDFVDQKLWIVGAWATFYNNNVNKPIDTQGLIWLKNDRLMAPDADPDKTNITTIANKSIIVSGDVVYISHTDHDTLFHASGITSMAGGGVNSPLEGNAPTYPIFIIGGPGRLLLIENMTTGKRLEFDYTLTMLEHVAVDLRPLTRGIRSNFFGDIDYALQPGPDYVSFEIGPEDVIKVWVDTNPSYYPPEVPRAVLYYNPTFTSFDGEPA